MGPLFHLVAKELLLLRRDWHALLLLFVMPALFILIMSLALRDTFGAHGPSSIGYYLLDEDHGRVSDLIATRIRANRNFGEKSFRGDRDTLVARVQAGEAHFVIVIPAGFSKAFRQSRPPPLLIQAGPGVEPTVFKLFEATVREAVGRVSLQEMISRQGLGNADLDRVDKLVSAKSLYEGGEKRVPSSVQQNVPAWLVFAMFFIAIPLSTTWVQERSLGTLARLKTMGISTHALLLGKLLPYGLVNLLQVALMLGVGVWVVPLCGGESLDLGHSASGLVLMALALSFASVSFALLVANVARTAEQATIFTAVFSMVMAALGGIMVPRFVMPLVMQKISLGSPLAWGLEGFLDIFLRQGGISMVAPWAGLLFGFGLTALGLAAFSLRHTNAK